MKAVKKANGSNHETSPLDRNKMSQLFFVQALCVCPLLNDKNSYKLGGGRNPMESLAGEQSRNLGPDESMTVV